METTEKEATIMFIRLKDVMAMCGMSRSAIYGAIKKGAFPAQVKLSERSSAWLQSEVTAWGESRIKAAREGRSVNNAGHAKKPRVA